MNSTIIIYLALNFLIFFVFSKISYKLNLVDIPKTRKVHLKNTAYTGGIIISIILVCAIQLFDISDKNLNLILSIAFLISIIGLIDDRYYLNAGGKLSLQIIPIFYLVVFENLSLNHIGDYNYFKLTLGTFAIPFTLICVLFLINSFNYFDGLDGTLGFSSISVLAILYYLIPNQDFQLTLIIILIPICIFLFHNFSLMKLPKLFLGDGGSLLLGFIISFILIYLANENAIHPILIAWSIVIFVYEFLSINIIRLKNKKELFKAGQDHLHYILYKNTNSIFLTNAFISLLNLILFLVGYFSFLFMGSFSSLILFIILFIIFLIVRNKFSKKIIKIKIK
jgi:UDP-GlcNAc:undecaprenyl-phosphate/decaprenyl-phosphate GlcNAc-1-phosphate transferase